MGGPGEWCKAKRFPAAKAKRSTAQFAKNNKNINGYLPVLFKAPWYKTKVLLSVSSFSRAREKGHDLDFLSSPSRAREKGNKKHVLKFPGNL